jgi:hypothetical protein
MWKAEIWDAIVLKIKREPGRKKDDLMRWESKGGDEGRCPWIQEMDGGRRGGDILVSPRGRFFVVEAIERKGKGADGRGEVRANATQEANGEGLRWWFQGVKGYGKSFWIRGSEERQGGGSLDLGLGRDGVVGGSIRMATKLSDAGYDGNRAEGQVQAYALNLGKTQSETREFLNKVWGLLLKFEQKISNLSTSTSSLPRPLLSLHPTTQLLGFAGKSI